MKNNKIIIGIAIVAVLIIGIIVFFATSNSRQESKMKGEVEKISQIDITKDNIDMNIKSTGDYGVVEKTIKDYMNNYSTNVKELQEIIQNGKIQELLTIDNFKSDGPEFNESLKYISEIRTKFNKIIEDLINVTNEETILKQIQDKNLSEEFVSMYKELMFGSDVTGDLNETINALNQTNTTINKVLDTEEKILNMLKENANQWKINEENVIKFDDEELLNKYNEFISEIGEIAGQM